jgi:hypothetical protein
MSGAHRVLQSDELEPAAEGRCALAIMTKAPRAGRVKTRLTPPLTPAESAGLNACFLRDTAAAIAAAGGCAQGIGCYTPVGEEEIYRDILPPDFFLIAQREGNFGERLSGALADLFSVGFGAVCLVDSDSPTIPAASFAEAAHVLLQPHERIVLGPSDDGGYYLIGMQRLRREIFQNIDWSTERVLKQTEERAAAAGLAVHRLPVGYDVDDRATLRRLCDDLLQPDDSNLAPASQKFLRELLNRDGRARILAP